MSEPESGQSLTGDVAVQATATDDADVQRVEFRVDGSLFATDDVAPFASTLDTTQVPDGAHTLTARAFDTSGNSMTSAGVGATVANTVPSLVVGGVLPSPFSPNGDGVRDVASVSYTLLAPATTSIVVLDGDDALVRILGADEAEAPGDHQVDWDGRDDGGEPAPDGDYAVVVEAVTATGTTTERRTVRLDTTAPETGQEPAAGVWHTGPVDVTLSATDALSTVTGTESDLDGLGWTAYGGPIAVASDGVHTLRYRSADEAGNVAAATDGAVKIDGTAPVTTQTGADGAWHATDVTVSFAATDDPPAGSEGAETSGVEAVEYRVDGDGWSVDDRGGAVVGAPADGSNDGVHLVEYHATDAAGNVEQIRSAAVGIDTQGPVVSDTNDDLWHVDDFTVALSAADGLSGTTGGAAGIEYSRDGGETWQPGAEILFRIWKRGGGSGVHELLYRPSDALGNLSAVASTSVLMDARAPRTADDAPRDVAGVPIPQTVDTSVTLSSSDGLSGVATTWYSVDGGDWVEGSTVTVLAPRDGSNDGVHWIAYSSVDNAGNAEYLRWCSVVIDALP